MVDNEGRRGKAGGGLLVAPALGVPFESRICTLFTTGNTHAHKGQGQEMIVVRREGSWRMAELSWGTG